MSRLIAIQGRGNVSELVLLGIKLKSVQTILVPLKSHWVKLSTCSLYSDVVFLELAEEAQVVALYVVKKEPFFFVNAVENYLVFEGQLSFSILVLQIILGV